MKILWKGALLLLVWWGASPAAAQETGGVLAGRAVSQNGRPIAFAAVRLVSRDGRAPLLASSDSAGGFRFGGVAPGNYDVVLQHVGFAVHRAPATVRAGDSLFVELATAPVVIVLAPIVVRTGNRCYSASDLSGAPDMAALWDEAQKGVEARRAFQHSYGFEFDMRQWQLGPGQRERRLMGHRTVTSDPDSVRLREVRGPIYGTRSQRRDRNTTVRTSTLRPPDELELLDPAFLEAHCIETRVQTRADGAIGLRFRPLQRRRDELDLRGLIWLDPDDYRVRHVVFEYLENGRVQGRGELRYADVPVIGGSIRFPVLAEFSSAASWTGGTAVAFVSERSDFRGFRRLK